MNLNRCTTHLSHWYTVEVVGQPPRYCGTDATAALHGLLTLDTDTDEGYVVADGMDDAHSVGYCKVASEAVELTAMFGEAHMLVTVAA